MIYHTWLVNILWQELIILMMNYKNNDYFSGVHSNIARESLITTLIWSWSGDYVEYTNPMI